MTSLLAATATVAPGPVGPPDPGAGAPPDPGAGAPVPRRSPTTGLDPRLRIGSLELPSRALVAPMAGITDEPFRRLASELGAGLVTTEMVAAEALVRSVEASLRLLDFPADVGPVAAQLVGSDPAVMAAAAQVCVERGAQAVDVNLGCPVRKVVGLGNGAALARDIGRTAEVLAAIVDAVPVPVTAKMRLGWDHTSINAPELSRALAGVGVRAVTIHGRTRKQGYSGFADWDEIARVKEAVDIPVIGSGDVEDVETMAGRIRDGRVDGVILARGVLGDLWLVRRAAAWLGAGERLPEQPFAERIALSRRHLDLLVAHYGDRRALKIGRKYVAWTIRGCAGASRLRARVQDLDTRERLEELFDEALASGEHPGGRFHPVFTSGEG